MITIEQIQQKIIDAIKNSGKTQKEIAEKLKINRIQISCYLHGRKTPSLETLANLCAVLDLDANDILCVNEYSAE